MHAGRGWLSRREVVARVDSWSQATISPPPPGCPTTFRLLRWGLEAQLVLGFSLLSVLAPGYGHPLLCSRDGGSRGSCGALTSTTRSGPRAPALLPSGSCNVSQTTVSTQPVCLELRMPTNATTWLQACFPLGTHRPAGVATWESWAPALKIRLGGAGTNRAPTWRTGAQSPVPLGNQRLRCSTGLVVPTRLRPYSACLRCLDPICRVP